MIVHLLFRDPGKKSFMFFTSELGKGFIISDEEEVWPHMTLQMGRGLPNG